MDLNYWWVTTSSEWSCPCCKRSKIEIVRLNKHGFLTGHLHEHHDHMADFVKKEFTNKSESRSNVVADLLSERFVERTAFALTAYDPTVICSDCNTADSQAKKLAGTPKEFSFSPSEIGKFIVSLPNKGHEIDESKAIKTWKESRDTFSIRTKLVSQIAEIAASNANWYQPSRRTAKQTRRLAEIQMRNYGLNKIQPGYPETLLYTTNKFSGNKDSWRRNQVRKSSGRPSSGEIQHLINLYPNRWKSVSDSWVCPICNRSKTECVRKSNKGRWGFVVYKDKLLYENSSPSYCKKIEVCNDCSNTATHIGYEIQEQANTKVKYSGSFVSPEELCSIIIPMPHSAHMINNEQADRVLQNIMVRFENGKHRV